MKKFSLFLLLLYIIHTSHSDAQDKQYWYSKNFDRLQRLHNFNHLPKVKNVVIFIGDGMGMTTISASRTLKRQMTKSPEANLIFDNFTATAFVQTDSADRQIPESAASGTALFCGVKTNYENLGVDVTANYYDACKNNDFVTTTRITHATPAALYAHSNRHDEDDSKLNATDCQDIARQLIENEPGINLNVIMGGGARSFVETDGRRKDGRNLTDDWINSHPDGEFITTRDEMMNIANDTKYVLGIFAKSHMNYNADRDESVEPSLAEMTMSAIDILSRNNSVGFLLVIEAGKIDLAHHRNDAYRALDDTLALESAVESAIHALDPSESLIIVTSDHASDMSYAGYATPKNHSVLGLNKVKSDVDHKRYQILTYSSGQGYKKYDEKVALNDPKNAYHKSTIPAKWSNHGAQDVPLYALGALSNELFHGTFDQTYVAHAIAFAMCTFQYESRCDAAAAVQVSRIATVLEKFNEITHDELIDDRKSERITSAEDATMRDSLTDSDDISTEILLTTSDVNKLNSIEDTSIEHNINELTNVGVESNNNTTDIMKNTAENINETSMTVDVNNSMKIFTEINQTSSKNEEPIKDDEVTTKNDDSADDFIQKIIDLF